MDDTAGALEKARLRATARQPVRRRDACARAALPVPYAVPARALHAACGSPAMPAAAPLPPRRRQDALFEMSFHVPAGSTKWAPPEGAEDGLTAAKVRTPPQDASPGPLAAGAVQPAAAVDTFMNTHDACRRAGANRFCRRRYWSVPLGGHPPGTRSPRSTTWRCSRHAVRRRPPPRRQHGAPALRGKAGGCGGGQRSRGQARGDGGRPGRRPGATRQRPTPGPSPPPGMQAASTWSCTPPPCDSPARRVHIAFLPAYFPSASSSEHC